MSFVFLLPATPHPTPLPPVLCCLADACRGCRVKAVPEAALALADKYMILLPLAPFGLTQLNRREHRNDDDYDDADAADVDSHGASEHMVPARTN